MKKLFLLFSIFFFILNSIWAEVFEYKHRKGDKYRILSVVKQSVLVNRNLSHTAEILNRIAVEVTDDYDGIGLHKAVFQTSERILYDSQSRQAQAGVSGFEWAREYDSIFERDKLGFITIGPQYYMPVVRNVPVFPDKDVKLLERWRAEGHEVHDFRDAFGITEPYRIPFIANYQFLGDRTWKEKKVCPAFSVEYRIDNRPPAVRGRIWPRRIVGQFNQTVYWDRDLGQPYAYEENFRLTFEMSDGRTIEYRGTAEAEFIEAEVMDREQLVTEIAEEIQRLDIPDVNVRKVDEGVSISLEDIGFHPDSAVMLPGEQAKLDKIAEILLRYPDRDIVVSGHTALAGSAAGRTRLSLDRAKTVTDYLLSKNVRSADRIVIRGYGADKPIADNASEEGRRRNRRVEITILEN
jgi:outer membrane protein OmpA-like peptidoglycan-associated protein